MSAIAGLWNFDGKPAAAGCGRMLAALAMYGPHHGAAWNEGEVALGRRLFRTLPEDVHDQGPVLGGDHLVLAADLRIDAREDLAAALGIPAESARTMADAALLLAAYERWELDCFERLVGTFACAIWDARAQRMVLARDFCGARSLFFHRGDRFFAFASMPKGLHALPDIPYAPDEQRAAEQLLLMPPDGSRSFFEGIESVAPGHLMLVTRTGITSRSHWNPPRGTLRLKSADEYAEALRHHLDVAVRAQLRGAGARVATHLSGGFDSAAVTATAARLMAPEGGRVFAFTSVPREGYDGPDPRNRFGDEGPLAARTAALYGNIEHVLVRTGSATQFDRLDRDFHLYDQPLLNLCSNVWTSAINDAARERGLSVMLLGQMGNFTISPTGMEWLAELIGDRQWLRWLKLARALTGRGTMRWRGVLAASFGPWMPARLWHELTQRRQGRDRLPMRYSAIHPARFAELDLGATARARGLDTSFRPRRGSIEARLWAMQRAEGAHLCQGAAAEWGIDLRDPTADKRLFDFSLAVPPEQYLHEGVQRALGRRALADRLPRAVIEERRKGVQAVDWHETLARGRPQLSEELARLAANGPAARALDVARLQELVEDWPEQGWERDDVMSAYRLALLRGVSVGHFLRKASGANT